MIETTDSFMDALAIARDSKRQEHSLTQRDNKIISYFLANPVVKDPQTGRRLPIQTMLHSKVRWLWQRQHEWRLDSPIEWSKWIDWLKQNWRTILKYCLMILPFLI